ncbi:MAG: cytochrome P460 family protein [Epsilonproteobacteria bacterium]|nr:cytochrome P460 family protein [Campylobacterota bacterium]
MKKVITTLLSVAVISFIGCAEKPDTSSSVANKVLPDLKMPVTNLSFKEIEGYENYAIVATHFRTDKNELRYILANPVAFKALKANSKTIPEGSKVVKIGWKVKEMSNFTPALEADKIQRVEYMIKDSKQFKDNPGGWGYARYVKDQTDGTYSAWKENPQDCVSCHNAAADNNFLFTKYQRVF